MSDPCLSDADVAAYQSGRGGEGERREWQQHLDQCQTCSDRVRGGQTVTADQETSGPSATVNSLQGDELPGYKILREIHRGGQGIVYQAIQESTRRKVAVKVLLQGPFADPVAKRRFEREIAVVGSLRHANIIPIFDSGVTRGGYYFVMEYVSGKPLAQYVRDKQLSIEHTLHLFRKVCQALEHAHQKGIIHRDLKPSNILVDSAGEPRVLDFGLARVAAVQPFDDSHAQLLSVTGQVMGTPAYMSPEQAAGSPDQVDMRSDVYTLGVILYQLLTDAYPYSVTGHMTDVLKNILEAEPVRPRMKRAEIDDEIETITLKCLSKEKQRRYDNAGALGRDIERYLAGEAIEAKRDSAIYILKKTLRRFKMAAGVGAAFAVLVLVALVVSLSLWRIAALERDRVTVAESEARNAQDTAEQRASELEAAYQRLNDSYNDLYFKQIQVAINAYDRGDMVRFRDRLDACPPDLRGWEWRHLNLRALLAERESTVVSEGDQSTGALAFSPQGQWFATAGVDGEVRLHRIADGKLAFALVGHGGSVSDLAFSPDGALLAAGYKQGVLRIWDLSTKQSILVFDHGDDVYRVTYSSDGRYVLSNGAGRIQRWNLEPDAVPVPIAVHPGVIPTSVHPDSTHVVAKVGVSATGVCDAETGEPIHNIRTPYVSHSVFSADGKSVLFRGEDGSVGILDLATGVLRALVGHDEPIRSLAVSLNGRWAASGDAQGIAIIWDLARGEEIRTLRAHEGAVSRLAISPDGALVLSKGNDGTVRLSRARAQQPIVRLRPGNQDGGPLATSPDGQWCVLSGSPSIAYVWDLTAGVVRAKLPISGERLELATFSPDGERMATCSDQTRSVVLWDTQKWSQLKRIDSGLTVGAIAFVPGSDRLAIGGTDSSEDSRALVRLWRWESDELRDIPVPSQAVRALACAPDGRRMCVVDDAGIAHIVEIATGLDLGALSGRSVDSIGYSSRGDWIGGGREGIHVWDAETFATLHSSQSPPVRSVTVSSDGTRIATAHGDGTTRLWDASTGKQALVFHEVSERVGHVAFSDGDRRLFSAVNQSMVLRGSASAEGDVPESTVRAIERRLVSVIPDDGWEYPVRLATRYLDHLPFARRSPEQAYSRLAGLIREARGRPTAQALSQDRQMDAVERVVMHPHNWLVVGPFRGGEDHDGLDDDLGPERPGAIDPSESFEGVDGPVRWQPFQVHAWSKYPDTSDSGRHFVNFIQLFPRSDHVIAYALTYIDSPIEQDVGLRIGSDDGVKVWLNDKLVHRNAVYRGFVEGHDRMQVRFKSGRNKLLVKLDQSGHRWGFAIQLLDEHGWPAELTWATEGVLNGRAP